MMQRREFLLVLAGGAALALPAYAGFADDAVAQLTAQGYQILSVSTTWLGRVRILATRDGGQREIVMNPRTGEILRDLWTAPDGSGKSVSIVDDVASGGDDKGSGSGRGSGDHSGSDDGNSGSGSDGSDDSGSDSGSGGSSGGSDDSGGKDGSGKGGGDGSKGHDGSDDN